MSELFVQGLEISILGLGLTFVALGLLIAMMRLVTYLFPAKTAVRTETAVSSHVLPTPADPDTEVTVAIAAALALAQERRQSQLGALLETGHRPWWYRAAKENRFSQNNTQGSNYHDA